MRMATIEGVQIMYVFILLVSRYSRYFYDILREVRIVHRKVCGGILNTS